MATAQEIDFLGACEYGESPQVRYHPYWAWSSKSNLIVHNLPADWEGPKSYSRNSAVPLSLVFRCTNSTNVKGLFCLACHACSWIKLIWKYLEHLAVIVTT